MIGTGSLCVHALHLTITTSLSCVCHQSVWRLILGSLFDLVVNHAVGKAGAGGGRAGVTIGASRLGQWLL